jgi:ABC-2 type transport system ATP-binding protein
MSSLPPPRRRFGSGGPIVARPETAREAPPRKRERVPPPPIEPDPGSEPPPIVAHGLTKRYDDLVAVDHLDLEIRPGEIFGLLGQNGAGKTTTILMLLGLTEPSRGWARVAGYDPTRRPLQVKRRVGYLPDAVGFYGTLTGRENLRYTSRLNGLDHADAEARIAVALEQVGMADRADTRADTYSRGMLQRLGIADALVKDPRILILDEPTAAIDPIGVVEILELLRRLADERGISILLSSHLLSQVQSTCDRVGIFASGRLIGVGTVADLSRRFGDSDARIEVAIDQPGDAATIAGTRTVLDGVPGVTRVVTPERRGEPWILLAKPEEASDVRVATLAAAARDGLRLTSIREVEASLDDIYRSALHAMGLAGNGRVAA